MLLSGFLLGVGVIGIAIEGWFGGLMPAVDEW